jgi:hypothetical protein
MRTRRFTDLAQPIEPQAGRSWRALLVICALLAACTLPAEAARDPAPSLRIPLAALGYQPTLPELLANGSSVMSVHFVGKDHMLVTFGLRRLIKRDASDPPDDFDRLIGAFYLELPSGKVLAKTEWRVHDRGQYLWDLGEGNFLLRIRDTLNLLQPLRAEHPGEELREGPLLRTDRKIVAINVSAERDLLTLETSDRQQVVLGDSGSGTNGARTPVQINFYRLLHQPEKLIVSAAGAIRSPVPLAIPATSTGYLDAAESKHDQWLFRYNPAEGKARDLAAFDSSCAPHPAFVSRGEFIAFGCRGSMDRLTIAGFNLNGDYMWQQSFYENYLSPSFDYAPEAGRFAMSRTLVAVGTGMGTDVTPAEISGQEVRVYQTYNGKVVLRLTCTPAIRAGQNFALSPDGLRLAMLRESEVSHKATKELDAYTSREATIDLYDLPPLNKEDRAAVDEVRKIALPSPDANIQIAVRQRKPPDREKAADVQQTPAPAVAPALATPPDNGLQRAADSASASVEGDFQPSSPRKPPTLYAPGEQRGSVKPEK